MKLALRAFAFSLVLAGAVAANSLPKSTFVPVSHQPNGVQPAIPTCDPNAPGDCGLGGTSMPK